MDEDVLDCLILYYLFIHYKRLGRESYDKSFLADIKDSKQLILHLINRTTSKNFYRSKQRLVKRIGNLGYRFNCVNISNLSFVYDNDVLQLMILMVDRMIYYKRWCLLKREARLTAISKRLMALHNLPKTLLLDKNGRTHISTNPISKEEALTFAKEYCEEDYRNYLDWTSPKK